MSEAVELGKLEPGRRFSFDTADALAASGVHLVAGHAVGLTRVNLWQDVRVITHYPSTKKVFQQ